MQFPPSAESHGGCQRAWFLLKALASFAPVHFVLLHPARNQHASTVSLDPIRGFVESVTVIPVAEWDLSAGHQTRLGRWLARWALFRVRSVDAPSLSEASLRSIAEKLPISSPQIIFAGRLAVATIVDQLISAGLLPDAPKVVDFDDIVSRARLRAALVAARDLAFSRSVRDTVEALRLRHAERGILSTWDAVSVCSEGDARTLQGRGGDALIHSVPNVTERATARRRQADAPTILFVGNLSFAPNMQGLRRFLKTSWPIVAAAAPTARLLVVGLSPGKALTRELAIPGVELHANVPSVAPYYELADIVIAPIFFGGGTRVKVIEAMAAGRAIVSTQIGVEGLAVKDGVHVLVANSSKEIAAAIVSLIESPEKRAMLEHNARQLQEERYTPDRLSAAVCTMLGSATARRESGHPNTAGDPADIGSSDKPPRTTER